MSKIPVLKNGQTIAFPTDTVFGLGAKLYDLGALKQIYIAKKRPPDKRIACLFYSFDQIKNVAVVDGVIRAVIKEFLPGPLTIILKAKKKYFDCYGEDTVGVRIPNNKIAQKILKVNGPLKTTSVNKTDSQPLNTYKDIAEAYYECFDYIISDDGIYNNIGLSSTVIDMTDSHNPKLLREGPILFENVLEFVRKIKNEN
ncbi:MAG: threonylcarbamoyl-AMP synthase [Acholeplasmatales bacterium]|jgi:L-threonylcarbamoyladenylate synthase|nr:threonylcarbamoyl-AMP synthase [Acholeplasmatales bacterium]